MNTAAILAVGSEMLGPTRVDTNSLKVTAALETYGVPVVRKSVVGDLLADLVAEIRYALDRADLLIVTGGLGPTEDDLTREALSEAFGLTMEVDQSIVDWIEARFAERGWKMPEVNRRQANVFVGQTTLRNQRGTAPGFHIETDVQFMPREDAASLEPSRSARHSGARGQTRPEGSEDPASTRGINTRSGKHVWVFPGVPHELEWMVATYFTPWLAETTGGHPRLRRVLKIAGMTESGVEEKLKPYYERHPGELVTILASGGQIEIHLASDSLAFIESREAELRELFGVRLFGADDDTMESVVGALLLARGETVSTAESCTGGLLGSRITDVAGSSAWFLGGAVSYTAAAKIDLAGVDPALIREHGEVSEPVALALARGARSRFASTWGVGITGIAGPTGGSPEKPVGTVHIAVAGSSGEQHRKLLWPAPRPMVKWFSTQAALDLLRRTMLTDTHK